MKILKQKKYWIDHFNDQKYSEIREKILDSFKELIFEEGPHKYYLHGKEITCVSNVTHMFKPEFDSETMAIATYERNYNNPESKYYQMLPTQILESWKKISKDACNLGSERHEFGESCFYFMTGQLDKILPAFKDRLEYDKLSNEPIFVAQKPKEEAIVAFWNDIPECIIPILAETKVYRENLGYSGTFDILYYYDATVEGKSDKNSGLCIYDYKTNVDLFKNFKEQKLLEPFGELLDMPLSIYKLQLSLYQLCLENIGLKCIARRLIWLKPTSEYEKIPLESYTKVLEKWLTEHPIEK